MVNGFGRFLRRNTIALLALFLALGGTTWAASSALIGRNTVASPQVVNGSLQTKDLSARARKALKGNRGLRGLQGLTGPQGAKGDTGTVDTSNFFTKTQSDGRYASAGSLGNSLILSGLDFGTIISTTTWDTAGFLGKFETGGGVQFLFASLQSLPTGAAITSVNFYLKHNVAGSSSVYLSVGTPSTGSEGYLYTTSTSVVDPAIQTLTITPTSPVVYTPDKEGLLFWLPGVQSANDVIYGAKVNYNPPTP
jgi:hypothetical protein